MSTIEELEQQVKQLNAKVQENTIKYPNDPQMSEEEKIINAWKRIMEDKDKFSAQRYKVNNHTIPLRRKGE